MTTPAIPILLTSSIIAQDPGVRLKNEQSRLRYAIESIEHWLRIDPTTSIVICDGSKYDLHSVIKEKFPKKNLEILSFQNDLSLIQAKGRGYGEGEIVRFAIKHSELINKYGCFAKCTSKLWVKNYFECKQWWNGEFLCHGIFQHIFSPRRTTVFKHIDTRFYIASVNFYQQYFSFAHHNIKPSEGYGLEECFHSVIENNRFDNILLPIPPVIEGVGGGTATYYKNSLRRRWKERLQYSLLLSDSRFSQLFANGKRITIAPFHNDR